MLNDLLEQYKEKFKEDIELSTFIELDEAEQIKILEQCIKENKRIYENDYYNNNYMEENI